ncbi:MATE family efflux transporter [Phaeobacter sp. B1627]|uniref:MATE family efflux transporter n=1 Tax=Phaeobacter sp. B1627 TaxID=2583809 RepID=UPI00111AF787|nr:MATE family efflux transporter [Phaeobacter sp. B1627]TNJ39602.1 hypothetical protein FGE21_18845 [Phaeobacter sp. B1627]
MLTERTSENSLTAWNVSRTALPIGAFYLTEILVGITDLAVVGSLGTQPLAAVGLGKTILLSILVVGFAVLSLGAVLIAEHPSRKKCGEVSLASILLIVPVTAIAVIAAHLTPRILELGGYEATLTSLFAEYAMILVWALPPALLFSLLKNVLNVQSRTGVITWISVGIVGGNLLGSVILVHGIGSWDGMEVQGAAVATVAVNVAASLVLSIHVSRTGYVSFHGQSTKNVFLRAREIASLGWASGAQQALESMLFIVVLYLLGMHSGQWLAAGTVVFAVMELNYAASGALGEVLSARMADRRTSGGNLRQALYLGIRMVGSTALFLAVIVSLFVDETVLLFTSAGTDEETLDLMGSLLIWTAPFFLMDAWQILFINALRGLKQTVIPMILSASCYWVIGIGGGVLLALHSNLQVAGIWIGFCLGLTSAATLLGFMAFREVLQHEKRHGSSDKSSRNSSGSGVLSNDS